MFSRCPSLVGDTMKAVEAPRLCAFQIDYGDVALHGVGTCARQEGNIATHYFRVGHHGKLDAQTCICEAVIGLGGGDVESEHIF